MVGLDFLRAERFEHLRGLRVGLLSHAAALTTGSGPVRSALQCFQEQSTCELKVIFGPEHGWFTTAQDLIPVVDEESPGTVPLVSLYGEEFESLKPRPQWLEGLDVLVVDLVDVGSRYYTFQATMLYCLEACAAAGVAMLVLDRPNPLGRAIEGPTIEPGYESFVGVHPIPICHGLSVGELAKLYQAERVPTAHLEVLPYDPARAQPGWIMPPSPNMPHLSTARVYPGSCLIEGSNLSEGRGTTRPFELIGFPGLDEIRLVRELEILPPPGIQFLPVQFQPTFQKHAGKRCGGVFLMPGPGFRPVRMGYHLLRVCRRILGEQFQWRTEKYEFIETVPAIDVLFGGPRERELIDCDEACPDEAWRADEAAFAKRRKPYLLYPESTPA